MGGGNPFGALMTPLKSPWAATRAENVYCAEDIYHVDGSLATASFSKCDGSDFSASCSLVYSLPASADGQKAECLCKVGERCDFGTRIIGAIIRHYLHSFHSSLLWPVKAKCCRFLFSSAGLFFLLDYI